MKWNCLRRYTSELLNTNKVFGSLYYSRLLVDEIISVQPMQAPTGQIFYMDFVYEGYERQAHEVEHL